MAREEVKSSLTLQVALRLADLVVERRSSIPILSCVRLSAGSALCATDLDMTLEIHTAATVNGVGDGVIVPLAALLAAEGAADGYIATEGEGRSRILRIGTDPCVCINADYADDDWPQREGPTDSISFELVASELAHDITNVRAAMSSEETRYYLNGMLWHVVDDQLRFAATDGHRLHRVSQPRPEGLETLKESIIPRKAIKVLARLLEEQPFIKSVRAEFGSTVARFSVGAATLTTRLIDGTFPDYKRVIPDQNKSGLKVAANDLIAVAELASRVMDRDRKAIVLDIGAGTVKAKSPGGIKLDASIKREPVGEPIEEVAFQHNYMAAALAPFAGKDVTIAMNDPAAPALITAEGDDRNLVVIMPMRV